MNLSYILGFIDEHEIHFKSRYRNDLMAKGFVTETGAICSDKLSTKSTHWLDFFDGMYLKRYIEEMVNGILCRVPVRYIRDTTWVEGPVRPGELLLIDGRFYFKRMNKRTRGLGQTRRVRTAVGGTRFTGEFDAWYCNSSSAHGSHLTGTRRATMLCLARSVEQDDDGADLVECTIVGLGLNLTQPDFLTQMMSGARSVSLEPEDAYVRELDQLADVERGQREEQYIDPPEACDICEASFHHQKYMIDGATKENGMWAYMCPKCFHLHGAGIGCGVGQLYLHQDDRWLLVGGFCDHVEEFDVELLLRLMEELAPPAQEE